jgi:hypothetical protein
VIVIVIVSVGVMLMPVSMPMPMIVLMLMLMPVIATGPMATPLFGAVLVDVCRRRFVRRPRPIASMAAAVRVLALSMGRPTGTAFLRFQMLFFGMANETHSGFLGRFVV